MNFSTNASTITLLFTKETRKVTQEPGTTKKTYIFSLVAVNDTVYIAVEKYPYVVTSACM